MKVPAFFGNICLLFVVLLFAGCSTTGSSNSRSGAGSRTVLTAAQLNANPPEYWVGQRTFYQNRMCWGYIKRPEQDWKEARLVLMREDKHPAPHRAMGSFSADNNYQYKLWGQYWDKRGYEPVMNRMLDVFVLEKYEPMGIGPAIMRDAPPVSIAPLSVNRAATGGPAAITAQREREARQAARRSGYEDID